MRAIRDRVRQFAHAAIPPSPEDFALASQVLGEGALHDLFLAQTPRDIRHAANTARWLVERGHEDRDLLMAALLHDIGKGQQRRWDRVAWVVACWSGLGARAASPGSRFEVRRAMARSAHHAETGARTLEEAGAPPRVVLLTESHHARPSGDAMLELLQAADAAN